MTTPQLPDPIRSVPAESGTLDAVLATARRRRARRLQAFGGTTAALVLVGALAVSIGGGDGNQSLGVTADGDAQPSVTADDTAVPTTHESTRPTANSAPPPAHAVVPPVLPTLLASPSPRPSPASPRPTATRGPAGPRPTPTPTPRRSPISRPTGEPSASARSEMTRRDNASAVCGVPQNGPPEPWCGSAEGTQVDPYDARTFTFAVRGCRAPEEGPGELHFGSGQEADFVVHRDGVELWRWSSGFGFIQSTHTLRTEAGRCWIWETTWKGVDDTGRDLPPGTYNVDGYILAEEFGKPMRFTVEVGE